MKVTIELEQGDYDTLHDVVFGLTDESFPKEHLKRVWELLPDDLQKEAVQWGIDDTCVRDNIYSHLKREIENAK